jgi:4-aminobutyrate aminotransferase / (S)-3-amino-2-methylpropionate transaminase / 5-aminovalerate transaminase
MSILWCSNGVEMIKTKYRLIKTEIPNSKDIEFIKKIQQYEPLSMTENQLPIVWAKAKDFLIYDRYGNSFIDFTSSIFVVNCGHSKIKESIISQADDSLLHTYDFPTKIRLKYLKALTKFTGFEKAFLLSSGTEATEAACKIMRINGAGFKTILSFKGAMHGKTFFAEALKGTNSSVNSSYAYPLDYPKKGQSWQDIIKEINPIWVDNTCGIIIESYRGWDAQFFISSFIKELVVWAKARKILVCFDEIQAGFGRTGSLFAYEHYGVKPDIVCCGKGIGGGVPLSAVLGSKELLDSCSDLSSTNSGNPLVCAAGLANIKEFENNNLISEANRKGKIFKKYLNSLLHYSIVKEVNCCGLVGAIVFNSVGIANDICLKALKRGLLVVKTNRESIKLGPPLTISEEALLEGLDVIRECIEKEGICK